VSASGAISARGWQPTPPARDLLAMGVLLFAPVLLVFPLSVFGETVGWVVGISLGWLAGLALLWSSTWWGPGEKGLATLVWPGGLAPAFLLATAAGEVCQRTAGGSEVCTGSTLPVWLGIPIDPHRQRGWPADRRGGPPAP
jgi:hypothetical protein